MAEPALVPRLLAEASGTFILVMIGPGAAVVDHWSGGAISHVGVALAFGLVVTALILALGDVSGAHLNPAVTLAVWRAGRMPLQEALPYGIAQLSGAVSAGLLLRGILPGSIAAAVTLPAIGGPATAIVEAVLTAVLLLVILGAGSRASGGDAWVALAVGATIGCEALMAGPLTGASMNPARSFGPAVAAWRWDAHWAYWAGPMSGALMGGYLHRILHRRNSHAG
ncbi:MAG TPA: aquaporin [Gemmatimonadales bacterium]|nr:aquaporin [Gemmatimonadales bacterium]